MRRVWSRRLMWSILITCSPPHKSPFISYALSSMLFHLLWDTSAPTDLFHLLPCTSQKSISYLNNTYPSSSWNHLLLWQCLTTTKEQRDQEEKKNLDSWKYQDELLRVQIFKYSVDINWNCTKLISLIFASLPLVSFICHFLLFVLRGIDSLFFHSQSLALKGSSRKCHRWPPPPLLSKGKLP